MLVQFLGPYLYRLVIFCVSSSFRGRTYINRPSSYQFSLSRDRTYIDRPSPCHVSSVSGTAPISISHSSCQFESGPHLYQSAIFLSVQFESGPHLYRSAISLSCQFSSRDRTYIDRSFVVSVRIGAAPISIGHLPISLSFQVGTAPISIGHSSCQFQFSSSRGRTYIDRPSSYHF